MLVDAASPLILFAHAPGNWRRLAPTCASRTPGQTRSAATPISTSQHTRGQYTTSNNFKIYVTTTFVRDAACTYLRDAACTYLSSDLFKRVTFAQCGRMWRLERVEVDCDSKRDGDLIRACVAPSDRAAARVNAMRDVVLAQQVS